MEAIWKAVERAKARTVSQDRQRLDRPNSAPQPNSTLVPPGSAEAAQWVRDVDLKIAHLDHHRVIAYNAADPRARAFDSLRTQVLQSMDQRSWQFLAVTSPGAGCGKTMTAVNLALSVARQPERAAILVDLDMKKPHVAASLGLDCQKGVVSVLQGQNAITDALIQVNVGSCSLLVLPAEKAVTDSSELITSRAMSNLLQDIKRQFPAHTVILDLPPMLVGNDVIALLPQTDCALLVAAVGTSTISEIRECNKHLQSTPLVRLVLNKVPMSAQPYYGY